MNSTKATLRKKAFHSLVVSGSINLLRLFPLTASALDSFAKTLSSLLGTPSWFTHALLFLATGLAVFGVLQTRIGDWLYEWRERVKEHVKSLLRRAFGKRKVVFRGVERTSDGFKEDMLHSLHTKQIHVLSFVCGLQHGVCG